MSNLERLIDYLNKANRENNATILPKDVLLYYGMQKAILQKTSLNYEQVAFDRTRQYIDELVIANRRIRENEK